MCMCDGLQLQKFPGFFIFLRLLAKWEDDWPCVVSKLKWMKRSRFPNPRGAACTNLSQSVAHSSV